MKRSEINAVIRSFEAFAKEYRFALPPFLSFTPERWQQLNHEYDEIRDCALGWDVTDYGEGNFESKGLALITLRSGNIADRKTSKIYTEKVMMIREGQINPNHYHLTKMEDMINRGGGNLVFRLWNATEFSNLGTTEVEVIQDGRRYMAKAGEEIQIKPGESITISPRCYHEFYVQPGTGTVLIGEVSKKNNDHLDNCYYEELARFSEIQEDEEPYRLLCTEYPKAP